MPRAPTPTRPEPAAADAETDDEALSDALDALAARQRQALIEAGALPPSETCSRKLLCGFCFIQIGPGCHARELWYHHQRHAWICRGCAEHHVTKQGATAELLAGRDDLSRPLGPLNRALHAQSKRIRKRLRGL